MPWTAVTTGFQTRLCFGLSMKPGSSRFQMFGSRLLAMPALRSTPVENPRSPAARKTTATRKKATGGRKKATGARKKSPVKKAAGVAKKAEKGTRKVAKKAASAAKKAVRGAKKVPAKVRKVSHQVREISHMVEMGAAGRLGSATSSRQPAFGPAGLTLYQVSIAQVLGDSGTAIDHASTQRWR